MSIILLTFSYYIGLGHPPPPKSLITRIFRWAEKQNIRKPDSSGHLPKQAKISQVGHHKQLIIYTRVRGTFSILLSIVLEAGQK